VPETVTGLFSPTGAVDIHTIVGSTFFTVTVVVSTSEAPSASVTRRRIVKTPSWPTAVKLASAPGVSKEPLLSRSQAYVSVSVGFGSVLPLPSTLMLAPSFVS
jgi:hypothetical protein